MLSLLPLLPGDALTPHEVHRTTQQLHLESQFIRMNPELLLFASHLRPILGADENRAAVKTCFSDLPSKASQSMLPLRFCRRTPDSRSRVIVDSSIPSSRITTYCGGSPLISSSLSISAVNERIVS